MSIPWIKIRTNLKDDPAIYVMARRLRKDPDQIVGRCIRLWTWADGVTDDGILHVTLADLGRVIGDLGFVRAMIDVGWLALRENGVLCVPNWERHNGTSAKRRLTNAERMRQTRTPHESRAEGESEVEQSKRERPPRPPADGGRRRPSVEERLDALNPPESQP